MELAKWANDWNSYNYIIFIITCANGEHRCPALLSIFHGAPPTYMSVSLAYIVRVTYII